MNSDILSFTSVATEEAEDVERTDIAAPSFPSSMKLGGLVTLPRLFSFSAMTLSIFAEMILNSSEG